VEAAGQKPEWLEVVKQQISSLNYGVVQIVFAIHK
jgi:hypothetical protein